MAFTYSRRVHFQDTDAAGVVFFANAFSMAHEAYEASLVASGIDLKMFFRNPDLAIPVVESRANFFRPLLCGDEVQIAVTPKREMPSEFSINYDVLILSDGVDGRQDESNGTRVAIQVFTRHVAIHPVQRKRMSLTEEMLDWIHQWGDPSPEESSKD